MPEFKRRYFARPLGVSENSVEIASPDAPAFPVPEGANGIEIVEVNGLWTDDGERRGDVRERILVRYLFCAEEITLKAAYERGLLSKKPPCDAWGRCLMLMSDGTLQQKQSTRDVCVPVFSKPKGAEVGVG